MMQPATRDLIRQTVYTTVDQDLWADHLRALDESLGALCSTPSTFLRERQYQLMLGRPVVLDLLAQSAFIRRLTPDRLAEFTGDEDRADFLKWFLGQTAGVEELVRSLAAEDHPGRVLEIVHRIWGYDPGQAEKFINLAIACGLVYDDPPNDKDAYDQFAFFVRSAERHQLKTEIHKLPASELVWVVDIGIPFEEMEWAQRQVTLSRRRWGAAYGMVPYKMEKAVNGVDLYEAYTLPEILCKGGVCADQAYFGSMTAKANGIPAMSISGAGQRGGHAWFGFKESPLKWNLESGRYAGDAYAAGTTRNPQTGKVMKEHELKLMADPQVRSDAWREADRTLWLGQSFMASDRLDDAETALRLTLQKATRHTTGWTVFFDLLRRVEAQDAEVERALREFRTAFRDYPDMLAMANRMEMEMVLARSGSAGAAEIVRQQTRKLLQREEARTDLILAGYEKQVELLKEAGDVDGVLKVYRDALREKGEEVVAFRTLAKKYFDFAKSQGQVHDAVRFIYQILNRHHMRSGDYFTQTTQAELMHMMADMFEQDNQANRARRLRDKADRMVAKAKKPWDKPKYKKSGDPSGDYDSGDTSS
jgi:hypothetical protein